MNNPLVADLLPVVDGLIERYNYWLPHTIQAAALDILRDVVYGYKTYAGQSWDDAESKRRALVHLSARLNTNYLVVSEILALANHTRAVQTAQGGPEQALMDQRFMEAFTAFLKAAEDYVNTAPQTTSRRST